MSGMVMLCFIALRKPGRLICVVGPLKGKKTLPTQANVCLDNRIDQASLSCLRQASCQCTPARSHSPLKKSRLSRNTKVLGPSLGPFRLLDEFSRFADETPTTQTQIHRSASALPCPQQKQPGWHRDAQMSSHWRCPAGRPKVEVDYSNCRFRKGKIKDPNFRNRGNTA